MNLTEEAWNLLSDDWKKLADKLITENITIQTCTKTKWTISKSGSIPGAFPSYGEYLDEQLSLETTGIHCKLCNETIPTNDTHRTLSMINHILTHHGLTLLFSGNSNSTPLSLLSVVHALSITGKKKNNDESTVANVLYSAHRLIEYLYGDEKDYFREYAHEHNITIDIDNDDPDKIPEELRKHLYYQVLVVNKWLGSIKSLQDLKAIPFEIAKSIETIINSITAYVNA